MRKDKQRHKRIKQKTASSYEKAWPDPYFGVLLLPLDISSSSLAPQREREHDDDNLQRISSFSHATKQPSEELFFSLQTILIALYIHIILHYFKHISLTIHLISVLKADDLGGKKAIRKSPILGIRSKLESSRV